MRRTISNQPQGYFIVGYPKVTDDPKIPGCHGLSPVLTSFALKLAFTEVTGLLIISPTAMTLAYCRHEFAWTGRELILRRRRQPR